MWFRTTKPYFNEEILISIFDAYHQIAFHKQFDGISCNRPSIYIYYITLLYTPDERFVEITILTQITERNLWRNRVYIKRPGQKQVVSIV